MNSLMSVAEQMIVSHFIGNESPVSGRLKTSLSLAALTGFLGAAGMAFLLYAAYLWMGANLPTHIAALYAGTLAIGLAILVSLISVIVMQYRKRREQKAKEELIETIHLAIEVADEELAKPVQDHPKTSILIASLAGYMIGGRYL